MKKLLIALCAFPLIAAAHVIEYDNGDIYTVGDDEYVFVSKLPHLWMKQTTTNTVQFKRVYPTEKVDAVPLTPNPNPIGTEEWCENHVPYENGYSFTDQYWERACDINNDGQFNICDTYDPAVDGTSGFGYSSWKTACNDGQEWDPNGF